MWVPEKVDVSLVLFPVDSGDTIEPPATMQYN